MTNRLAQLCFCSIALLLADAASARAQTTTYFLHNADSGDFCCRSLTTSAPAPTGTALQGPDLKNATGSGPLFGFQNITAPGLGGVIPSGSTPSFTLWMKKTSNFGVIRPTATLSLNNGGTAICNATGADLTSTLSPIAFQCNPLPAGVLQTTTDKLTLWVGYTIVTSTNHTVRVELDIDGSTNSRTVVPNPVPAQITSLNPTSAPANASVTITGTNFRSTQGTSTVKFANTAAAVSAWGDTSITAVVPTGLNPGPGTLTVPVVVRVAGANSNSANFDVIGPPSIASITPTSAHRGDTVTIAGANFLATQGTSTVKFFDNQTATPTAWSDTSITTTVPAAATAGGVTVTVSGQTSNAVTFNVIIPGTIAGTITRASDSSPLQGATVQAVLAGVVKSTATTPVDGTYSLASLDPATYDLRVLATGYSSEVRSTTVTSSTTTTVDVAMSQPGSINGQVTASGTTPLPGAAVTMFLNGIQKGSTNTDALGNYSIAGLHPGSYTLQVVDVGYRTKEQGAVINDNAATTANVSLDVAPAGPVSYAYDALGRLVSVVDPSGEAATYAYDAVGNILSVGRIGSGTVAITQVTPNSAPVNTPVTIYGTGFSTTPSENIVTFPNNKQAVVTSSTATTIVTSVPGNADVTAGNVAVAAPLGSASKPFTVTAPTAAPTISSFTPGVAAVGAAVTVSGTNFDTTATNDRVLLNQTFATPSSATSTSLGLTVPAAATSGPISVSTVNGTAVSATDLIIPPPGYTGADIDFTSRIGFGDANALTVPVNVVGKIALVLFEGTAGHRAAFKLSNSTYFSGVMTVLTPYGAQFLREGYVTPGRFFDTKPLMNGGTYSVILAPNSTTGSILLTVYDVPPDLTGPIVPGGQTVTANIQTPGQNARYTFTGAVNQRVALTAGAGPVGAVSILSPSGTALSPPVTTGTNAVFLDTVVLPAAGTYSVFADPTDANTGSLALTLHDATDVTTSFSPSPAGTAINVSTAVPGQRVVASFAATAGQRVSLKLTNLSLGGGFGCKGAVSIVDPNGATLRSDTCLVVTSDSFLDVTPPLAAGTHQVIFDPAGNLTGGATLTLYDVPADSTGPIGFGEANAVTVSTTVPGENASRTFTGTNLQRIALNMTNVSIGGLGTCTNVTIKDPSGNPVASNGCVTTVNGGFIDVTTLQADGQYTISIDPGGPATGSITLTLYDVPADFTGTLTLNDPTPLSVPITAPAQNANLTFTLTSTQSVRVHVQNNPFLACTTVRLTQGTTTIQTTTNCGSDFFTASQSLAAGSYTIVIDPPGLVTATFLVSLVSP